MKYIKFYIIIFIVFSGIINCKAQRNPLGMKFQNLEDSLFYVSSGDYIPTSLTEKITIDYLHQKITSLDDNDVLKALVYLRIKKDERSIPYMSKLLQHDNEKIVKRVIHSLEIMNNVSVINPLGKALTEYSFDDKIIYPYIIKSLENLTFAEGIHYLDHFVKHNDNSMLKSKELAGQAIETIKQFNDNETSRTILLRNSLKKPTKQDWALRKIMGETNKESWILTLREFGNTPEFLAARKELGDLSFTHEELKLLELMSKARRL